ncbi:polyprenyl diphosphate synthase [Streptomyces sp. NPDC059850]|uniref:polyprenyl diphosphate synthase n=1 Tax=Streptomyces sp. NPDC059850 TaxID=3346970 RepID=UPI00365471D0
MQTLTAAALDIPRHIGFIADGNRRWAQLHGTTAEDGFRQGAVAVHQTLERCRALGVQAASVFLMSERNFGRSEDEVAALVDVIVDLLNTEAAASTGPLRVLTQNSGSYAIPDRLLNAIEHARTSTANRTGMTVCLGIGYDGRADIRQAVTQALRAGDYHPAQELPLGDYLSTRGLPDLDLIVRTSGERRLSAFLLWQSADATIHFDDRLWPDFDADALVEALTVHAAQTRTYGR